MRPLRVLLFGDTHVGFDTPRPGRARVERRRRGEDFLHCFERALEPALRGEVDLVVHGGDLFHRSEPSVAVAERGLAPLRRVAEAGVPVFLVPGNHERARIPCRLLASHPNLHVFDAPATVRGTWAGWTVEVAGFPFVRRVRGPGFRRAFAATGMCPGAADVQLLCIHQAVEGARCGPGDFTFRHGADVVAAGDLPRGITAVLSGHIHRRQRLTRDLAGRPLPAPVYYAGSVERTSFAEWEEEKSATLLELRPGRAPKHRYLPLPARPMVVLEIQAGRDLEARLGAWLRACPADAVVRVDVRGGSPPPAARVRALAPPGMNVDVRWPRKGAAHRGIP